MKPDSPPARMDPVDRAHLRDPRDASHVVHRYPPSPALAGLVQRYWVPVWSVPPGAAAPQSVLQYPVALVVVTADYARFYGVTSGLSTTTLTGDGWAVGVLCAPAAGSLLTGGSMARYTDRSADLAEVLGAPGAELVPHVRAVMAQAPADPAVHARAIAAVEDLLRRWLPVDGEGELVNRLVAHVESHPEVTRVDQLCAQTGLSERALQRLLRHRLGLTPKWLVQRRRLQEAAERLRSHTTTIAEVAATLGYADQSHLTRDFARVTGMTPGEFAARHAPGPRSSHGLSAEPGR